MTPQAAQELLVALQQQALGIDELLERARLLGSTWSRDQLELFLLCMAGIECDVSGLYRSIGQSLEAEIQAALIEAVRSFAGKPVAANQVRARLPGAYQERSPLGVLRSAPHESYSESLVMDYGFGQ